jgi:hypothetical protein
MTLVQELLSCYSYYAGKGPWVKGLIPEWCYWEVMEPLGGGA